MIPVNSETIIHGYAISTLFCSFINCLSIVQIVHFWLFSMELWDNTECVVTCQSR